MGLHDGHRQRMRERILQSGLQGLQQHEVLEYLLFSFIPRKDTNEIAHLLIDKFGSLSGVLNASAARLKEVKGMTESAAIFLSSLPDVFRIYVTQTTNPRTSLKGRGAARSYMGNMLFGVREENLLVAALDSRDQLILCEKMAIGSGDAVLLNVRRIVDFALSNKASSILIAHNHPSGKCTPSQSDFDMTTELFIALSSVGVKLQDHFVFCDNEYFSFEEHGLIQKINRANDCLKEGIMFYE